MFYLDVVAAKTAQAVQRICVELPRTCQQVLSVSARDMTNGVINNSSNKTLQV